MSFRENGVNSAYQPAYTPGRGVSSNHKKAAEWFTNAANNGHAKARYNLCVMYENGWGVEKDLDEAGNWFKQAAKQEHPMAMEKLGDGNGRQRKSDAKGKDTGKKLSAAEQLH